MPLSSGQPQRRGARGMSSEGLTALSRWQSHAVSSGQIPSSHLLVWRDGCVVHDQCVGLRTSATPNAPDTIYRFYSMTKPIVSVALMQLYEQGKFLLTDPVHLYLGANWKKQNMRVYDSGSHADGYTTVPCRRSITIKDLLTHTSGLSYGFDYLGISNKVDEIYYKEGHTRPCGNIQFAQRQKLLSSNRGRVRVWLQQRRGRSACGGPLRLL